MKKLTYEFIKEDIEYKGYKVLTNHYINSKKNLAGLKILLQSADCVIQEQFYIDDINIKLKSKDNRR